VRTAAFSRGPGAASHPGRRPGVAGRIGRRSTNAPPSRSAALGFVFRLLAFWASGAILFAVCPAIDRWAIRQTVGGLSFVLHILARRIAVSGNGFSLEGASVQIVSECTTLLPSLLLAGAIIAYPANIHRKLLGLTAGLALLWMFNAVRIIVLLIILARYPSAFDLIHIYLWQTLTMAVIAGIFGLWLGTGTRSATA